MSDLIERAGWLADKLHNGGDYGKEAAALLVSQAAELERLRADAALVRAAALEDAAREAEHWQKISRPDHKCGEYIAAAIRAIAATKEQT